MLWILVEVGSLAHLTHLGGSGVEVFGLCDDMTIFVFVILFHLNSVSLVLIRSSVESFSNNFSRLKHDIMTSCFVSIMDFFSLAVASLWVVGIAD